MLTGRTWVGEAPKGARFDRHMEFVGEDGKVRVRAITQWAIIDKASGRPIRVPPEVIAPVHGRLTETAPQAQAKRHDARDPLRLFPLLGLLPGADRAQPQGRRL